MSTPDQVQLLALSQAIDPSWKVPGSWPRDLSPTEQGALSLASACFPPWRPRLAANPRDWRSSAHQLDSARHLDDYKRLWQNHAHGASQQQIPSLLRTFAASERIRIALREVLASNFGGDGIQITAQEISDLAACTIEIALSAAIDQVNDKSPGPLPSTCQPRVAVLGMGKLGGNELNPGSDIDLIFLYDADRDECERASVPHGTLQGYWTTVARQTTALLGDVTSDGFVWRVDLRLRPEGSQGPIIMSRRAMLDYYEKKGRPWERLALLRARGVAGSVKLGQEFIDQVRPFVFSGEGNERLLQEVFTLNERARIQLGGGSDRDLKLGIGGIRDVELLVQTQQLLWAERHHELRAPGTLRAVHELHREGLLSERDAIQLENAYVFLRAVEHAVQSRTGRQTHQLPASDRARRPIARMLGFPDVETFDQRVKLMRDAVQTLVRTHRKASTRYEQLRQALATGDRQAVLERLSELLGDLAGQELARNMVDLYRYEGGLLSEQLWRGYPGFVEHTLSAIFGCANPTQASRFLSMVFAPGRVAAGTYVQEWNKDPRKLGRLIDLLGASSHFGRPISLREDAAQQVLEFNRAPSPSAVGERVAQAVSQVSSSYTPEQLTEASRALRRAKFDITTQTIVGEVTGELSFMEATEVLTELADVSMEQALRFCFGDFGPVSGICVLALGKLGGRELGYSSDLDIAFVFDGGSPSTPTPHEFVTKTVRKMLRILSTGHPEGPGYQLDLRLRPSGSQGPLVTTLAGFAAYHGLTLRGQDTLVEGESHAQDWERQALVRARICAGDKQMGARLLQICQTTAFERGPADPHRVHEHRLRYEKLGDSHTPNVYNIKYGPGGLLDVEFCVQTTQMAWGHIPSVRTPTTWKAIDALEQVHGLTREQAHVLRESYGWLRRLDEALFVVDETSRHTLRAGSPQLLTVARRLGVHALGSSGPSQMLIRRFLDVTTAVRKTYLEVMGV